ncbi:MAG: GNAT family N-acetyltransferase [Anaerolineales bacterium]|uniref:GNAT family N-acetyltransferase n=1 Tax=Candidatus Villigracilis vicinus TaxID=3140679 RepID=UPI00313533A9|nr:GNAT family N-acetyltransferase [Anaerolineales bacterium]MBK7448338.1 GNAT family N-acetyltransferase [Anaerolineales bacterium]MBK9780955.1 GNAT family N-acetyltransferase [Anaerolineales bacterium]
MTALHPNLYERIRPLLLGMDFHLIGRSILAQKTPAQIFVDDHEHPSALFAQAGHRYVLAGNAEIDSFNRGIQKQFRDVIFPKMQSEGQEGFALYYDTPAWEKKISALLSDKEIIHADREYYACKKLKHKWQDIMPEGFQLKMVDADLLASPNLKHLDTLKEEMTSERPSVEDFLAKSFGMCAIHEGELAGWCLSEYNTHGRCEIGIETISDHRQLGIGTALTLAFLEHAFSHGIQEVGWHCFKRNEASAKTALKAGFDKIKDYKSFIVLLKD